MPCLANKLCIQHKIVLATVQFMQCIDWKYKGRLSNYILSKATQRSHKMFLYSTDSCMACHFLLHESYLYLSDSALADYQVAMVKVHPDESTTLVFIAVVYEYSCAAYTT